MRDLYTSSIIFEFDGIVDIDLAILRYMQIKFPKSKYLDQDMVKADDYFLKCQAVLRTNPNPLSIIFKEEYHNSIDKIYKDIIKDEYDTILKYASPLGTFSMITTARRTDGLLKYIILCKNQKQEQYIKSIDAELQTSCDGYTIDVKKYDGLLIKDYHTLSKYDELINKSIYVLGYTYNLEPGYEKENVLNLKLSADYFGRNRLLVVSPYSELIIPEY